MSSSVLTNMKFSSKIIIISPLLLFLLISLLALPSTATTSTCGATDKAFSPLITEVAIGGPKPAVVNTDIKTKTKTKTKYVYRFGGDEEGMYKQTHHEQAWMEVNLSRGGP